MVQMQAGSGPRRGLGPKARTPPGKQKKKKLYIHIYIRKDKLRRQMECGDDGENYKY